MPGPINRVLISGAAGFIGSHLTRRLLQEGCEVGIDTSGVFKVVQDFQPDIIFHLATYYTVAHKPDEIQSLVETNVLGTLNLLEAARMCSVEYLVNTSSSFVYGEKSHPVKEEESLKPLNLYALTKLQAEQACSFYAQRYGLRAVTLRLYPPYGPHDHERKLIPHTIKSFLCKEPLKLTTGEQKWDYIHVSDIIDAYARLLDVSRFIDEHKILNIGTGKAFRVREVIEKIQQVMGVEDVPEWGAFPHRENEVMFLCADIEKARKHLDWEPGVTLGNGLESTITWFKEYFSRERSKDGKAY